MEVQANRAAPGIHSLLGLSVSGSLLSGNRRKTFSGLASEHTPFIRMLTAAGLGSFFSISEWGSPRKLPVNGNNRILQVLCGITAWHASVSMT